MPTLPFNDLAIHPRDNDLVLASHGRGMWILDRINALQELTPAVVSSDAHLFTVAPAHQIRYTNLKAHAGDMVFRGENPPNGAIIDFWVAKTDTVVSLSVHDAAGQLVQTIPPTAGRGVMRGVNRVVWNLRHAELPVRGGGFGDEAAMRRGATWRGRT